MMALKSVWSQSRTLWASGIRCLTNSSLKKVPLLVETLGHHHYFFKNYLSDGDDVLLGVRVLLVVLLLHHRLGAPADEGVTVDDDLCICSRT